MTLKTIYVAQTTRRSVMMRRHHRGINSAPRQLVASRRQLATVIVIALSQLVLGILFYRSRALHYWAASDAVVFALPLAAALGAQFVAAVTSRQRRHWGVLVTITIAIFCFTMIICLNTYGA
jgi:hypothetical protein